MFAIAAGLALFGTMMVYSASAMISQKETGGASQFTYFYKQFAFTAIGLAAMFVVSRIDYRRYQASWFAYGALALTAICLVAVFAFPVINGASRWIRFGGLSFQPSEMAKIALPIFLAFFLTKNETSVGELRSTVVPCLGALVLLGGLIVIEPDLGTTIVLCAIFSAVYFAATLYGISGSVQAFG
jgi:cell division protein FtsW